MSTGACALTSKADLVTTRYFTPERPKVGTSSAAAGTPRAATAQAHEIRLGRVTAGSHLRERIAYRDAAYEVGYYEDQHWTERPDAYVRRGIARTLFEERGFSRTLGGAAPTLDIEVLAFDELRLPAGRAARVAFKVVFYEDRAVLFEETVTVDRPVAAGGGKAKVEDVVAAMGEALDTASEQVAARITTVMAGRSAPVTPTAR